VHSARCVILPALEHQPWCISPQTWACDPPPHTGLREACLAGGVGAPWLHHWASAAFPDWPYDIRPKLVYNCTIVSDRMIDPVTSG